MVRLIGQDASLARSTDAAGRSAFVLAHVAGHVEIARILQKTGLELDLVESYLAEDFDRMTELAKQHPEQLNAAHPIGGTPLYAAALVGSVGLWRLRALGCRSDEAPAGGSGFTPARAAMDCAWLSGARIAACDVLGNGGDANAPQKDGDSVLHGAVRRRSTELVRIALRKGARVEARDAKGRSARDLAVAMGWEEGAELLRYHDEVPRDHRASRFAFDANRDPVEFPDLSDVSLERQCEVTGSSHFNLPKVKDLVGKDPRLVFSISGDNELAIEACAHVGNAPIMRFHLDHGSPFSLPTAISLGDAEFARFLLDADPLLIHERGAHDFPVLWYVAHGTGSVELAQMLIEEYGADVGQESAGTTALHRAALRGHRDLAAYLIDSGADVNAVGYSNAPAGETPLQVAVKSDQAAVASLLRDRGAS